MSKKGLDVSYCQPGADYSQASAAGIDFIIPKEGQGDYIDSQFLNHVKKARNAGLEIPGVYHFIEGVNVSDAVINAMTAIKNVEAAGLPKNTVIWCDLEYATVDLAYKKHGVILTEAMQKAMTIAFCNHILASGYPTGIYTNPDYIYRVYGTDILQKYDLWLAHWTAVPSFDCVYWQFGTTDVPGIGEVDTDIYYGKYTAGTAKPQENNQEAKKQMSGWQIMTDQEWVERMKYLARHPSDYKNYYPWNLLKYSNGRRSADCHNLQKALFNGRDVYDTTEGSFQTDLSATGDSTEYGLLLQCSDIQWGNFKTLKLGEPRCLYMEGHFGAWLGEEWSEPGQGIVNCVESTPRWEDGIQFSYIDPDTGDRYWAKGNGYGGRWEAHGLASKWVLYTDEETQAVVEESKKAVDPEAQTQHFDTKDLAVQFIRNNFGNGYENRLANARKEGYADTEVRAAQDLVNKVVKSANDQKKEAEQALTIITEAYDCIAGKYGDGSGRRAALVEKYGESMADLIRDKVEELLTI